MKIQTVDSVKLSEDARGIDIIDQTLLPAEFKIITLRTQKEIWDAIYLLKTRGAPAIGVTAAYGLYLAGEEIDTDEPAAFLKLLAEKKDYLASSRPTAVNLFWALERTYAAAKEQKTVPEMRKALLAAADKIFNDNNESNRRMGEYGADLIREGDGILTHCNAGYLATVRYGTAIAPMYVAAERGLNIKVYADETRPLLQGARLSAYEMHAAGLDTTLICDNMAASLMRAGKIQAVFLGGDRVAANGDFANKIGTLSVAVLAHHFGIPFYSCIPLSTMDINCPTGAEIEVEQRPAEEVTEMWYTHRMAPEGVKVYNPAFDVTPHELVTGFITDYGVLYPPFDKSIREAVEKHG